MTLHDIPLLTNEQRDIISHRIKKVFCGKTLPSHKYVFEPVFICMPKKATECYAMQVKWKEGLSMFAIIISDMKAIQLNEVHVSPNGVSKRTTSGLSGQWVDIDIRPYNVNVLTLTRDTFKATVNLSPYADLLTVDHPYIDEWSGEEK